MTPFGHYLEKLRRSRNLQQTQLAAELGVHSCYVSAMEKGRKGPAAEPVLKKLVDVLNLDEEEQRLLWRYVKQSKPTFKIPKDAGLAEYAFVNELWGHLGSLTDDQLDAMKLILKMRDSQRRVYREV